MIEMRWLCTTEEENIIPPVSQIQFGKPFDKHTVVRKKLQYRQMIDVTVRAAAAGMWDAKSIAETANMQWSAWKDVPEYVETDTSCP